jgi:hypothetical protein
VGWVAQANGGARDAGGALVVRRRPGSSVPLVRRREKTGENERERLIDEERFVVCYFSKASSVNSRGRKQKIKNNLNRKKPFDR